MAFLDLPGLKHFIDKIIGKTDISGIGDGTLRGAVAEVNNKITEVTYFDVTRNRGSGSLDSLVDARGYYVKIGDVIFFNIRANVVNARSYVGLSLPFVPTEDATLSCYSDSEVYNAYISNGINSAFFKAPDTPYTGLVMLQGMSLVS